MQKIKGWVVLTDNKSKVPQVPVNQRFFMCDTCAECLRNKMNLKHSLEPETHIYPYKIAKATLTVDG